jgi:L-threonylcarbamoyladenylate synthase
MTDAPLLSPIDAAPQLRRGAVLAYPTEAVWGLGCDPFDEAAVHRLLALKDRPVDKGLILIAAARAQLDGLLDWDAVPTARHAGIDASWPGPNTWVVPATARVPRWITGMHAGVAVRVSAHPVVIALCEAFGGPLVSTSANPAGAPAPSTLAAFDAGLRTRVDGIVAGETGGLDRPTVIRDALSGDALRL